MTTKVANSPLGNYVVYGDTINVAGLGISQIQYVKIDKGAAGASSPVTDANPMPVTGTVVSGPSTFSTTTNASITVTTSASKQTILAANDNRKFASVSLQGTAVVHLELSDNAASTTRYWAALVNQYDYLPIPNGYTGIVTAISITSSSAVVVKEG